jgi:Rod binding domain-containing protein
MNIQFPAPLLNSKEIQLAPQQAGQPVASFQQALDQASVDPNKLANAAKQFEALMMGQVLKAARSSSDGGWLGTGDDPSSDMTMELGEQQLAQALAARGGMGIARMVTKNLDHSKPKVASSGTPNLSVPDLPSKDSVR